MTPLDGCDHHVESCQRPLQLQPGEPATRRRVWAQWVFYHQAMRNEKPLEQPPADPERRVEQGPPVEMKEVEDHEHDGDLAPKLRIDLFAAQAVLELKEPEHLAVAVRQHLAVEQDAGTQPPRALYQLGECAGGLLKVSREQLDATIGMVQLTTHTVVFLLRPYLVRVHPLEGFGRLNDRARTHEANLPEKSALPCFELRAFGPNGGRA